MVTLGFGQALAETAPAPATVETAPAEDAEGIAVSQETSDLRVTEGLDDRWLNILLLGGDSRSKSGYARTDSMIILSVNQETAEVKLCSIMRDIWVNLYGVGWNKINAANVYGGPELAMRTVNENFGMNIQYYAMVNMTTLARVVDAVGGVEVDIDKQEMGNINMQMASFSVSGLDQSKLKAYGKGTHLTGNQALAYTRNRTQGADYERTERQRDVLLAVARKLKDDSILGAAGTVASLMPYVKTNVDIATIVKLASVALGADISAIKQMRVPADGTFESGMKDGVWTIRPDFEANVKRIHDFIYADEG